MEANEREENFKSTLEDGASNHETTRNSGDGLQLFLVPLIGAPLTVLLCLWMLKMTQKTTPGLDIMAGLSLGVAAIFVLCHLTVRLRARTVYIITGLVIAPLLGLSIATSYTAGVHDQRIYDRLQALAEQQNVREYEAALALRAKESYDGMVLVKYTNGVVFIVGSIRDEEAAAALARDALRKREATHVVCYYRLINDLREFYHPYERTPRAEAEAKIPPAAFF